MSAPKVYYTPDELPQQTLATLVRTPPTGTLKGIITCQRPIATPTHYHARRTVPCALPPNCPLCEVGLKWRLHCYLSFINLANLAHEIVEFPARQYDAIANWYRRLGSIRGLYFEASRPNGRPNGPIQLSVRRPASEPASLPDPLPIEKILCKIWGVPEPDQTPQPQKVEKPNEHPNPIGLTPDNHKHTADQTPIASDPQIQSILQNLQNRTIIPND